MKKITRRSFLTASGLLAAATAGTLLTGCGSSSSVSTITASSTGSAAEPAEHEPITIMDASRDYTALMELVHEKYPEINLQIEPYHGRNTTAYMRKQLLADRVPDIYNTTQVWDDALQKEHLLDLASYSVTELYNPARLNEVDVDGATYLLPYDLSFQCLSCNRSLLERLGLSIPTSFAQLRDETAPALRAAGMNVADCLMNLPGYPFQYFFGTASTDFVNTLEGRQWQHDFIHGDATAAEALQSSKDYFQQWIDCGMINYDLGGTSIGNVRSHFKEGSTGFMMSQVDTLTQNADGTGDEYVLLPYLSDDGTHNAYTVQPTRYYGLSKHLAEPGNEQKLEDALHFLEVLSTQDGYIAVGGDVNSTICSIKDFSIPKDSPYYDVLSAINNGYMAPQIYAGWEDYVVPFGNKVLEWISGSCTGDDALAVLDETKQNLLTSGPVSYAVVTEELNTAQTAQLCGQIFMGAADTDAALISYNVYYADVPAAMENGYGANGSILQGDLTEEDITSFLPTGWYDTLKVITKPGAYLRQMAKDGCDMRDNGRPYPYVFLTKDGQPLDDDTTYTCVLCGYSKALSEELDQQDTGIVGLDAAKEYFLSVGEISSKLLDDSLLQN